MGEDSVVLQAGVYPTGHICTDCGESLDYTDEVWLLQVMKPQQLGGQVFFHQVIDENDPQGDFLFEPYFFCFKCWENTYEAMRTDMEDEPPVPDADGVIECVCCGSGIRAWEYSGVFTLGEFHVSKRAPNGVPGPQFETISAPDVLCLYCLTLINDDHIVLWDDLSHGGECSDCIQGRCWRWATCACVCHTDTTEEEQEQATGETG